MGGRAFSQASADGQKTLNVVRMSADTYERIKTVCVQRLENYFEGHKVQSLKEAPGKKDYGDLDLIIRSDGCFDPLQLAMALGARGVIWDDNEKVRRCILAVPQDGSKCLDPPIRYHTKKSAGHLEPSTSSEYVQVDVELIPPERFEWYSFYSSYGDLAALLGQILHNRGFMVSNKGLSLRLQELDDFKTIDYVNLPDQDGIIFLSHNPESVMAFLKLDQAEYEAEFQSQEDFFAWLSKCRLLTPQYVESMQYKRSDTSNQRQKDSKRPMIREFFHTYLPSHISSLNLIDQVHDTRPVWQDAAVDHFGVREQFERTRDTLMRSKRNQTAAHLLKPIITTRAGVDEPKKLNELLRAFRRWVQFNENNQPCIRDTPQPDHDSQLYRWLNESGERVENEGAVGAWVEDHWEELKYLERGKADTQFPGSLQEVANASEATR